MCKHLSSLQHDKTEFMGLNPNKPTKHLQFSKCSQQVYGLLKYRFINEHIGVSKLYSYRVYSQRFRQGLSISNKDL